MVEDAIITVRISKEVKRELEDKGINVSEAVRDFLDDELKRKLTIGDHIAEEEAAFSKWISTFLTLYIVTNDILSNKDNNTLSEIKAAEQTMERINNKAKTAEDLCNEIPEIKELTYEDVFDIPKILNILDKYPSIIDYKIGIRQIQEYIVYRGVVEGNFKSLSEGMEKFKKDKRKILKKREDELESFLNSPEYKYRVKERYRKKHKEAKP